MSSKLVLRLFLFKYIKHYWVVGFLCLFIQIGTVFIWISYFWITKIIFSNFIPQTSFLVFLKKALILYTIISIIHCILNFLSIYLPNLLGAKITTILRQDIFRKIWERKISFIDNVSLGDILSIIINDVIAVENFISDNLFRLIGMFILSAGIIIYLSILNLRLTLIIISLILIFVIIFHLINFEIHSLNKKIRDYFAHINSFFQENLEGFTLVKVFNRQERQKNILENLNEHYFNSFLKNIKFYGISWCIGYLFKGLILCLLFIFMYKKIYEESGSFIELGTFVVFITSLGMIFVFLQEIVSKNKLFQMFSVSLERIFEFMEENDQEKPKSLVHKEINLKEKIEFKDVWFSYKDEEFVLKNFNLEIKKGEQIGIVGRTGAGKTTIANLLLRFYDVNKGEILIDGVNVKDVSPQAVRSLFALIPQETFIFSGSIADNISLGDPNVSIDLIKEAAKFVGLDNFIKELPNGYNEDMKEAGNRLSEGQKQLISFARAYVFNRPIIIFDEATSQLDNKTMIALENTLERIKGIKTTIIIAHHLSTVRFADKIIVLDKGEIQEVGTHQELLEKKGIYYRLWQLQRLEEKPILIEELGGILSKIVGYYRQGYIRNASLAKMVGERMGLSFESIERLKIATLIYDIGKIFLPKNILTKEEKLTPEEYELVKTHVKYSKEFIEKWEEYRDLAEIVYYHHERWDGKGYLCGLKGEEIPLESRIISVIDAYYALTNDRPYRKALSQEEAKSELIKCAGTQFDPSVVKSFLAVLEEEIAK
ncbi:MAG: ABC transporter transmembrane domain-containing protein [Candidatus Omnitrophica bacterium]|nr:ABC transporter transmembrane domain-containing protein [Candidatus Omnitrophota bacterium]